MQTKHARKILRQYHEAVKAVLDAEHEGGIDATMSDEVAALRALLPQADEAVKALTERFP